jgi:putative PIN family toxin of toxin-antitoxin system
VAYIAIPPNVAIPSDALPSLGDLLSDLIVLDPRWAQFLSVPRQHLLVVDTSVIMNDLYWRSRNCQDRSARTALKEAIDADKIIVIAPRQALDEVESKIRMRAGRWKTTENALWQEFAPYQDRIHFHDINLIHDVADHLCRDLKDQPFIDLYLESGADAIATSDKDILTEEVRAIGRETIIALRDCARAESVVLHTKLGGFIVIIVVTESTKAIWALVVALARAFVRLPVWLQLVTLTAIGTGALHPRSRTMIGELVSNRSEDLDAFATMIQSIVGATFRTFADESEKLADAQRRMYEGLPEIRRQLPLEAVIYSVCYAAREPLSVRDIARAVVKRGYQSRSRTFLAYLRKVLRKSERLVCGTDGLWTVARQSARSKAV